MLLEVVSYVIIFKTLVVLVSDEPVICFKVLILPHFIKKIVKENTVLCRNILWVYLFVYTF